MSFDPSLPDDRVNVSKVHPLREALVLVGGVLGVAFALFVAIAVAVDFAVPRLPPSLEMRLFSSSWIGKALAPDGAAQDERTERLEALLDRLVRHWPECPYEFRVGIQERAIPNALAFPGGWIVVTSGLLEQVASENELAFVLGHELGHYRDRDHLRGLGRGVAFSLVMAAMGMGGAGGATRLAALSGKLAERSFDREQERAADRFGLELVELEYGNVAGAWDFFERVPDLGSPVAKRLGNYFATHPLSRDRIDALKALAVERGWSVRGRRIPWPAHPDA